MLQASPAHAEALSRAQAANMVSFRYPGGQEVSILVSKNSGRYRLQSGCLEAMWLVLQVSTCGWNLEAASSEQHSYKQPMPGYQGLCQALAEG